MASRYLGGTYSAGYTLTGAYSAITIGTAGSIGGAGLLGGTNASYGIANLGHIAASYAGASGILLQAGGTITNGSTSDTAAVIAGAMGSSGIAAGAGGVGVSLSGIGSIGNWGTIAGGAGGFAGTGGGGGVGVGLSGDGSIGNWGTIAGGAGGNGYAYRGSGIGGVGGAGISLSDGGSIGNWGTIAGGAGGLAGTGGAGGVGVSLSGGGSIGNWGTIAGGGGGNGFGFRGGGIGGVGGAGISLSDGGSISNSGTVAGGTGGRTSYLGIGGGGGDGIDLMGGGSIGNSAAIIGGNGSSGRLLGGYGGIGILLSGAGSITNTAAVIGGNGGFGGIGGVNSGAGGDGIHLSGSGGVTNAGTIAGGRAGGDPRFRHGGAGINLADGGDIANSGTIIGGAGYGSGISLEAGGSIGNWGTIAGGPAAVPDGGLGAGIVLSDGGIVTNGSAGGSTALIAGGVGVQARGTAGVTLTNYGTIASPGGTAGTAVSFANADSVLILEGGSKLVGTAVGAGGTLDLAAAGGAGTLAGLGSQYVSFAQYAVLSGADWNLTGGNTMSGTLVNHGTLRVASGGVLSATASAIVDGAGIGSGGLAVVASGGLTSDTTIAGGRLELADGAAASGTITFSGSGGTLQLDSVTPPAATIGGLATSDTFDLVAVPFDSTMSASFDAAAASLTVSGGGVSETLTLAVGTTAAGFIYGGDGSGGTDVVWASTLNGLVVSSGQRLTVSAGQSGSGITVLGGGALNVASGGSTANPLLQGSATLALREGAIVDSRVSFAGVGGDLEIAGTASPAFAISGFLPGDTIDLSDIAFDSSGSITLGTGNVLQVVENGGTTTIDLNPSQNFAEAFFRIADDGGGGTAISEVSRSRLAFVGSGSLAESVNIVLTPDGTNLPAPVAGAFNIEIFTATAGELASGYDAAAFISGATLTSDGLVQAGTGGVPEQLLGGSYLVLDETGYQSIEIVGADAGGSSITVAGSTGDTIGGSTVAGNSQLIDASALNPLTKAGPMTITGGAGATTVWGGKGDIITGGAGVLQVTDPGHVGGQTIVGGAGDLHVFDTGKNDSITGGTAGTTLIDDNYGSGGGATIAGGNGTVTGAGGLAVNTEIVGAAGDTISGGSGTAYIDGIAGAQSIAAGAEATTVQAAISDTVTAGAGTLQVYLDSDQATTTVNLGAGHGAASLREVSVASATGGAVSVSGFATPTDVIQSKTSVTAGGSFLGTSTSDGSGGTILTFLDGTTMTLAGVSDASKITFTS